MFKLTDFLKPFWKMFLFYVWFVWLVCFFYGFYHGKSVFFTTKPPFGKTFLELYPSIFIQIQVMSGKTRWKFAQHGRCSIKKWWGGKCIASEKLPDSLRIRPHQRSMVDYHVLFFLWIGYNWMGWGGGAGRSNKYMQHRRFFCNESPMLSPPHKWFEFGWIKNKLYWVFLTTEMFGNMAKTATKQNLFWFPYHHIYVMLSYHEIILDLHLIISSYI